MKKYFGIFAVLLVANSLEPIDAAPKPKVNERTKRSLESYFENYFDEMANSACVAMGGVSGLYFAVRRACANGPSCHEICTSHSIRQQAQIWDKTKLLNSVCVDSLHVYKQHTSLAENKDQETDLNKVGITIYRYKSCHDRGCGPNYCCCTGPQN